MKIIKYPQKEEWANICKRPTKETKSLTESVNDIITQVQDTGDEALRSFCQKFDGYAPETFKVPDSEIDESENKISPLLKQAIE